MSYTVSIAYDKTKDLLNLNKHWGQQDKGPTTPVSIPGLVRPNAPSDSYIYASAKATGPVYNQECFCVLSSEEGKEGEIASADTYKNIGYVTSGQRRWAKEVTDTIWNILDAYAIPQVPVYRAWQSIKMAICKNGTIEERTETFTVETFAESEFYREVAGPLTRYGITVVVKSDAKD